MEITETEWISSETERYLWKYYFMASLIFDNHSFVYLPELIVNVVHFNNVYVHFSPGSMRRIGRRTWREMNIGLHC